MSERVFTLPNVITLLRIAAVPGVAWLITQQKWEAACWLFLAAAVSDGIDGFLARWLRQMTQLGAALDTVADKALGVVTLVTLTQAEAIPLWVTVAILLPSGDQVGVRSMMPGVSVILRMSPFSAGAVRISPCASKTARTPVGEMAAERISRETFWKCGRTSVRSAAMASGVRPSI